MFCFETDATVSSDTLGPLRDLVFGAWDEVLADCAQNRGGSWWNDNSSAECAVHSNLNGIYPRCGKETLLSTGETLILPVPREALRHQLK